MSSTSSPSLSDKLAQIQRVSSYYVYSIEMILGVSSCCLNISLLCRRQFRTLSIGIYFLVASIAMLINLTLGIGTYLYAFNNPNPNLSSLAFCKLRNYLQQVSAMTFRWCLVAGCFDRLALSSSNMRWRNFAKVRVARYTVSILIGVWFVLPSPMLFYSVIKGNTCGAVYNLGTQYYQTLFTIFTGYVLPASVMITCAFLIHQNLVNKRKRREAMVAQPHESQNDAGRDQRKRDRQVLIVLLVQSFVFLLTLTPWVTYSFYNAATLNMTNKSADRAAIERFIFYIIEPILYLFPVSSFYLYILTSTMFRRELVNMFRSILRYKIFQNHNRIEPDTNTGINENRMQQQIQLSILKQNQNHNATTLRQLTKTLEKEENSSKNEI